MRSRLLRTVATALALAGCYASHGTDATIARVDAGPGGTTLDAGDVDAAGRPDAAARDAGPRRDGGGPMDAGPRRDAGPLGDGGPRRDAGPRPDAGPGTDAGSGRPALRVSAGTYMSALDSPAFDQQVNSALEAWVRPRSVADALICQKGDGTARHLLVAIDGGRLAMGWQVALDRYLLHGPPALVDRWTYMALSITAEADGTHTGTMYVDGVEVDSGTFVGLTDSFNDQPFTCGRAESDVDEVRIWRIARSSADIGMTWRSSLPSGIPGMIAYYRLDESGQLAFDHAFGFHHAVLGRLTTPDSADPMWIGDGPF
ncbi:MAG: LamG-like jellyroll fold domain-containing protein [Sandaracinaceae bacterium]